MAILLQEKNDTSGAFFSLKSKPQFGRSTLSKDVNRLSQINFFICEYYRKTWGMPIHTKESSGIQRKSGQSKKAKE